MHNPQYPDNPTQTQAAFQDKGYTVLTQVIDPLSADVFATYALWQQLQPAAYREEKDFGSKDRYSDILGESYLFHLRPMIEGATGLALLPTFSFLRIYQSAAILTKHTDRPACEVTASLVLGYQSAELWPLILECDGKATPIALDRGDMLIYKGCHIPHWREPFTGKSWVQVFFHYVDAAGQSTALKYDRRGCLGFPLYPSSKTKPH